MSDRYLSLSKYLKEKHNKKFIKLSIDGGFTCPNRDGRVAIGGCIFCSERGSGEFTGDITVKQPIRLDDKVAECNGLTHNQSIPLQIEAQKKLLSEKWSSKDYIAYFQSYSNTYGTPNHLKAVYDEALACEAIRGLAIATRSDCVGPEVVDVLKAYRSLPVFWVELGFQTANEASRTFLNLHIRLKDFEASLDRLKTAGIPVVLHVIAGLPGETRTDFLESIKKINAYKPFGIKIHMLNILKETLLADEFEREPFALLDQETYISWVCDALMILDPEITVHRLTGDGAKDLLIAPMWIKNKRAVLNGIQKEMTRRKAFQGSGYS